MTYYRQFKKWLAPGSRKKVPFRTYFFLACFTLVLFISSIAFSVAYLHERNQMLPRASASLSDEDIIVRVHSLMELPDETPAVASVEDPTKLEDQVFFARAQISDKVLIYPHARLVVLYRPSLNRIIEVASLSD